MFPFFKSGTKTAFTVKTGTECNFFNRNIGGPKQKLGGINPGGNQILVGRKPRLCSKHSGKMKKTHVGIDSKCLKRKRFTEMLIDIDKRVFYNLRVGKVIPGIRTNIQQSSEKLRKIRGYAGFPDRFGIAKHVQNLGHIMDNGIQVAGRNNISLICSNQIIVIPGKWTVKMNPVYSGI